MPKLVANEEMSKSSRGERQTLISKTKGGLGRRVARK